MTLNFPELTIEEVVDFLRRNTNVNFVLDPQVSGDDIAPITMSLQDVKLRNALEFIMLNTGLKYSLQGEAVFVSNEDGLRGDVFMRVYDVRDLTLGLTQFPGPRLKFQSQVAKGLNSFLKFVTKKRKNLTTLWKSFRKSFLKTTGKSKALA